MSTNLPDADGQDIARFLAAEITENRSIYDESGLADVAALLDALGGEVVASESDITLLVWCAGRFRIIVAPGQSVRRRRLAAARTLYRYVSEYLFADRSGQFFLESGDSAGERTETEMTAFASALLLPAPEFLRAWDALDGDDWKVAAQFDVSPGLARHRHSFLTGAGVHDPAAY